MLQEATNADIRYWNISTWKDNVSRTSILTMVRFENVGMRYGVAPEVLRDISFSLQAGSFHFITGASGAGKSTLLRLLYLAHRPSRGLITMFQHDLATADRPTLTALRRKTGIVFQDFRLLDHLSLRENVALPLKIDGLSGVQLESPVEELVDWRGLGKRMDAHASTLSGGEKQRLAIARAVIRRPSLLLADEPTGSVDPDNSVHLFGLFRELNKLGTSVVIATHDESLFMQFDYPRLHLLDGLLKFIPAGGN